MQIWGEFGPYVGRNLAARRYNVANRYLPGTWGWAAADLTMDASDPLVSALPQCRMQREGKRTVGREPLHPSFNEPLSIVSFCGAPSTPSALESATSAPHPQPRPNTLMDVGEGYGKSQPFVKAPSSNMADVTYLPK